MREIFGEYGPVAIVVVVILAILGLVTIAFGLPAIVNLIPNLITKIMAGTGI